MAKPRHQEPPPASSRNTLVILVAGALVVAGLIAWALTRTVEKPAAPSVAEGLPSASAPATAVPAPTDTATATLAPQAAPAAITGDRSAVKRIAAEDVREKLKGGTATVIDVRAASAYAAGHIPGALNLPLSSIESNMDLIPKGREIITYCT